MNWYFAAKNDIYVRKVAHAKGRQNYQQADFSVWIWKLADLLYNIIFIFTLSCILIEFTSSAMEMRHRL